MNYLRDAEVSLICELLDGKSLATVRLVNKLWYRVANSLEVRKSRFVKEWSIHQLLGDPRPSSTLLEKANINNFVYCHDLNMDDTLARLAIKYKTSPIILKILNGLSCEEALNSRSKIFVPVENEKAIETKTVAILYSQEAKRECFVVFEQTQLNLLYKRASEAAITLRRCKSIESAQKRLIDMFSKKYKIETDTAKCYLSLYKWDVWKSMKKYEEDTKWENSYLKKCEKVENIHVYVPLGKNY